MVFELKRSYRKVIGGDVPWDDGKCGSKKEYVLWYHIWTCMVMAIVVKLVMTILRYLILFWTVRYRETCHG